MDYVDIVYSVYWGASINHAQLDSDLSDFLFLCEEKHLVEEKHIMKKETYNKKKYQTKDPKRAKATPGSNLRKIAEAISFAYEAYDDQLRYDSSIPMIHHFYNAFSDDELPPSYDEYYKRNLHKARELKSMVDDTIAAVSSTNNNPTIQQIATFLVSSLPDRVYSDSDLYIYCELYRFAHSTRSFTLRYKHDRHISPISFVGSYLDLHNKLKANKHLTTKDRLFRGEFMSYLGNPKLSYTRVYELLMYDFNPNFFSNKDVDYVLSQLGIFSIHDFYHTIQIMITL
jgi:hypothetical protein